MMSADVDEPTPDLDELIQSDVPPMSTVPVRIEEPAGMWILPNRRVRMGSELAGDTQWQRVLDQSKKRSRAVLVANGQPMRIRTSTSGNGALWPANTPFEVRHTQEVMVRCAVTSETVEIGIVEEFWAD